MSASGGDTARKNRRTTLILSLVVAGMFAFGFALVPLYRLVCKAVGSNVIGQATREAPGAFTARRLERTVTVEFDATVNAGLPWAFHPVTRRLVVHPGEMYEADYVATNHVERAITAQAVPGITPWQATAHFHKIECFCFSRQTLGPRETREMPLKFVIDPDLPEQYKVITLSYMMMAAPEQAAKQPLRGDSG